MRCTKCGTQSPDETRFCPVCGHKLQSGRGADAAGPEEGGFGQRPGPSRLLDFQGWSKPGRGLGPYIEASALALILAGGVAVCQFFGVLWPLYPLVGLCAVLAWLRRL